MTFLRRLLRRTEPGDGSASGLDGRGPVEPPPLEGSEPEPPRPAPRRATPTAACPYCAFDIEPPPARNRLCPSCRQPIVVRRVNGRLVLLVDAALPIFERERLRTADELHWAAERASWLKLAETVHVPASKRSRLAKAEPSAASVATARDLYLAAANKSAAAARRKKRWSDVAAIRRAQAAALYQEAAGVVPPPDTVVSLRREAMLAELRTMTSVSAHAELVGARCCPACRADDGKVFPIAAELLDPRLPHEGCPKGLCACDWWLAMPAPPPARPKRRRSAPKRPAEPSPPAEASVPVETSPSDEWPSPADDQPPPDEPQPPAEMRPPPATQSLEPPPETTEPGS